MTPRDVEQLTGDEFRALLRYRERYQRAQQRASRKRG
jgi:hypothetical protein